MTFIKFMKGLLNYFSSYSKLFEYGLNLYSRNTQFWNYGLICLIGVGINQVILHLLVSYLPLWLANSCAILVAWSWNYINAIGKLKKYWG